MTKCSISRCGNDAVVKGLCRKHYMRLRRNGDATATKTPGPKPGKADPIIEELARAMVRDRSSSHAGALPKGLDSLGRPQSRNGGRLRRRFKDRRRGERLARFTG